MKTTEIASRLVSLCREAKWETAQKELFAADAVSIEAEANPSGIKETKGLPAIIAKGHQFNAMTEKVHSLTVSDPVVAESSFACAMSIDLTMKAQPRMQMSEICVYKVKDGKIISEEFHN